MRVGWYAVAAPALTSGAFSLTRQARGTPPALMHNRVVHEHVVLLTIVVEKVARVPASERVRVEEPNGFRTATARCGFMQTPDVPRLLEHPELRDYWCRCRCRFLELRAGAGCLSPSSRCPSAKPPENAGTHR